MLVENRKYNWCINLPYHLGILTFFGCGVAAFPMVFDQSTVAWFNEVYVTGEVPEEKDQETVYEIGNWSWNWMEPLTGTFSFFILCL